MVVQEFADYLAHQSRGHGFGRADPQFTCGWVCQAFQLADTGSQIIEQGDAASCQRASIHRGFYTLRGAIKKAYAQQAFKFSDGF